MSLIHIPASPAASPFVFSRGPELSPRQTATWAQQLHIRALLYVYTSGLLSLKNSLKSVLGIDLLPWGWGGGGRHKHSINTCQHSFGQRPQSAQEPLFLSTSPKFEPTMVHNPLPAGIGMHHQSSFARPKGRPSPYSLKLHRLPWSIPQPLRLWTWDVLVGLSTWSKSL